MPQSDLYLWQYAAGSQKCYVIPGKNLVEEYYYSCYFALRTTGNNQVTLKSAGRFSAAAGCLLNAN